LAENAAPAVAGGRGAVHKMIGFWILLATCPSMLLLATTSVISEEVSVVPFMWVFPLLAYLVSFILCFSGPRWYVRWMFVVAGAAALLMLISLVIRDIREVDFTKVVGVYTFLLFVVCMICHGELVRLRPPAQYLTSFYLSLSIGGALGGLLAGIVAPFVFTQFYELYLGYWGCVVLLIAVMEFDRRSAFHGRFRNPARRAAYFLVGCLAVGLFLMDEYQTSGINHPLFNNIYYTFARRATSRAPVLTPLASRRNFYGRLRVKEWYLDRPECHYRSLAHGRTLHGTQFLHPDTVHKLYSYYSTSSGFGLALLYKRNMAAVAGEPLRIGVVGLGAGTLAMAGQKDDFVCFYEINPVVPELAVGPNAFFTYLRDTPARTEIVMGDARISLEREPARQFDLLVLDAFSGDSPPVHLLTREAVDVYRRHLKPDGILAIHASNRYLNYRPVVWRLAEFTGMHCISIYDGSPEDDFRSHPSLWMLLTLDDGFAGLPVVMRRQEERVAQDLYDRVPLWTDDYSNIYHLLRNRTKKKK
jgi:hypothetical protein